MQAPVGIRSSLLAVLITGFALGCAATTPPPPPPPPQDFLVVLNAGGPSLSLIPVPGGGPAETVPLGNIGGIPRALTAHGSQVLVTTGAGSTVARLDLSEGL